MSKLEELKSLLKRYKLWVKKRLGQNFLIDDAVFEKILGAADLKRSDTVIEVGPGTGFLTEQLIEKAGRVVAVEKDADMVRILSDRFAGVRNLELVHDDILKVRSSSRGLGIGVRSCKVVANIPYYITSPLLKHFLQSERRPKLMVLLVQREVAGKVCGTTGKSLITIETQLFGRPEIVGIVPPTAFHPAPKVQSAILRIEVYKKPLIPRAQMADFLRVVKFGFSQKRKKLKSSLAAGLRMKPVEMAEVLQKVGIDPDLRAENLEIDDWKRLSKALKKLKK